MKDFILPIIAFIIGLVSLYVDKNDKRKRWIFLFCLIVTVSTTVVFNFLESKKNAIKFQEAKKKEDDLTQILLNITNNTNQIPDLVKLLMKFGFTAENAEIASPEQVSRVIKADKVYDVSLSKINYQSASQVRIEYFPKDVDGKIVNSILEKAGFKVIKKDPINNHKTNAIWAGDSVSVSELRVVALVLYRAGVDLIKIDRFKNGKGSKSKLIQIGADPALIGKKPLQLNDITNLDL